MKGVEAGARLVGEAGKTMDELVASVRKVAEIMTEIASASHEQSSGIEQINKAITQMDTVVQMNASLVEEATAAASSMAGHGGAAPWPSSASTRTPSWSRAPPNRRRPPARGTGAAALGAEQQAPQITERCEPAFAAPDEVTGGI